MSKGLLVMWQVLRRIADAQFAPGRGARVVIAMLPPLVVLEVLGRTRVGSRAAAAGALLGVLFVASCDLGPSLRIRARAMAAGAGVGALLLGLGTWVGGPWWVAVPALAVTTFLGGLLPPYGPVIAQVGIILTLVFALAMGRDGGPANAALTALGFLLGGMAFLVLALAPVALRRLPHPSGTASRAARARGAPMAAPGGSSIPHAPVIRLAALRAAGTALVAGAAWGSGIAYPHWAAFVVILSVRPDQMAALRLTTQRVVGTVLGAGLADGMLHLVHDPLVVAGLAIGGEFLAVTVKDVNFTVFVFFLTAQTLLLVSLPTPGQAPAALRVATTMLGAMVALGISVLGAWLANRAAAPPGCPTRTTPGSAAG